MLCSVDIETSGNVPEAQPPEEGIINSRSLFDHPISFYLQSVRKFEYVDASLK